MKLLQNGIIYSKIKNVLYYFNESPKKKVRIMKGGSAGAGNIFAAYQEEGNERCV